MELSSHIFSLEGMFEFPRGLNMAIHCQRPETFDKSRSRSSFTNEKSTSNKRRNRSGIRRH
jgi:hypothetical protein